MICLICGVNLQRLGSHLGRKHGIHTEEYYLKYVLKRKEAPKCINHRCNNLVKWRDDITAGYPKACSNSCHVSLQNQDPNCNFGLSKRYKDPEFVRNNGLRISKMRTNEILNGRKQYSFVSIPYESPKAGSLVLKSSYELKYCKLFDSNQQVVMYKYESISVSYFDTDSIQRSYIIDFELLWSDGNVELIEVKPSYLVDNPTNVCKFLSARLYAEGNNAKFTVLTEKELYSYA